jgi:hypothetical protein
LKDIQRLVRFVVASELPIACPLLVSCVEPNPWNEFVFQAYRHPCHASTNGVRTNVSLLPRQSVLEIEELKPTVASRRDYPGCDILFAHSRLKRHQQQIVHTIQSIQIPHRIQRRLVPVIVDRAHAESLQLIDCVESLLDPGNQNIAGQ